MNLTSYRRLALLAVVFILAGLLSGCSLFTRQETEQATPVPSATTAPVAVEVATAAAPKPTSTSTPRPTSTATPRPTATRTPLPSPTLAPTNPPAKAPEAVAPAGPKKVIITESDVAKFVSQGALAQYGANVQGLNVRFTNGRMHLTADSANYGMFQLDNIDMVGRPVARNGVVSLVIESMSPGGFVSSMVPGMANQALAQYTSQWYVEDVQVKNGQVELTVR